MSGNHSRYSHQRARRYAQLNMLQGAMVTDADQNEAQAINQRHDTILGGVTVGSGVPATGGILRYRTQSGPPDLISAAGLVEGLVLAQGVWGELRLTPGTSLPANPSFQLVTQQSDFRLSPAAPASGRFAAVADVWDRHVGLPEDHRLVDPAFLGAETAVRKERVTQIKFVPVSAGASAGLREAVEGASGLPTQGGLRLVDAALRTQSTLEDPCDPCATVLAEEDRVTDDALFRIEVHASPYDRPDLGAGGAHCASPETGATPESRVMLKYARDNAAIEIAAEQRALLLNDSLFATSVFELYGLESEQQMGLAAHVPVPRQGSLMNLAGLAALTDAQAAGKIVRVWDGAASIDLRVPNLAPQPVGAAGLGGSIERTNWVLKLSVLDLDLEFHAELAGSLPFILPGDAWCVDIREYAPPDEALSFEARPVEITHRYAYLGEVLNGAFLAETASSDFRSRRFPALTTLEAQEMRWSNHHHTDVHTNTVQGAIDLLFSRNTEEECLCTYCIDPERDLAEQLEKLAEVVQKTGIFGTDAFRSLLICFPRGHFELVTEVTFTGLAQITLRGAGRLASEVVFDKGARLVFTDCSEVCLHDLGFSERRAKGDAPLSIEEAQDVTISACRFDSVALTLADSTEVPVPFVHVLPAETNVTGTVTVRDSDFAVLENRLGLKVSGRSRRIVRDCRFEGAEPQTTSRSTERSVRLIDRIRALIRPMGFRDDIARGQVQLAQGSDLVLDFGEVPQKLRRPLLSFLREGMTLFDLKIPRTIAEFETLRQTLSEAAGWVSRPPGKGGAADSGKFTVVRSMRSRFGGGNTPEVDDSAGTTPGPLPIERVPAGIAPAISADGSKIAAWKEAFDKLNRAVVTETVTENVYCRNFGIWMTGDEVCDTQITGNRFRWVHSAIVVKHQPVDQKSPYLLPASRTVLRDNLIERAAVQGATRAVVKDFVASAAICCHNAGYLQVAGNTIQQPIDDVAMADDYLGYLAGSLSSEHDGFAAISVTGSIGPVAHFTANDATWFRHCLFMHGEARTQTRPAEPGRRPNMWTFRENTVLPCADNVRPLHFEPDYQTIDRHGYVRLAQEETDWNHPAFKF